MKGIMKTIFQPLLLVTLLFRVALATFSLQDQGPDWSYTTKHLAPTTSQKCKDAYIAPIECDPTLLGLVASMRPLFKPTSQDLANTCTSECAASLEAYVQNVKAACIADGDRAQESQGAAGNVDSIQDSGYILRPVETIGLLFQYVMARSCRKNSQSEWCYEKKLNYPRSGLTCSDECSIGFFKAAHDFPVSSLQFNYYLLISRGQWWADMFVEGWNMVVECGKEAGVIEWLGSSGSTSSSTFISASATQTQSISSTETGSKSTPAASTPAASTPAASTPAASTTVSSVEPSASSSSSAAANPTTVGSNGNNLPAGSLFAHIMCWMMVVIWQ